MAELDDEKPRESWWLCPREEFTQRQKAEQARMVASTFGQAQAPVTGPTTMRRSSRKGIRDWKG